MKARLHLIPSAFFYIGLLFLFVIAPALCRAAEDKKPDSKPDAAPDVLILSNGDTLHGKFVKELGGKVTFHTDSLGDVNVTWDKIKELHAAGRFAVLDKTVKLRGKKNDAQIPTGSIDATSQAVTVQGQTAVAPIPVKDAQFIIDAPTLDKQLHHEPGFFAGWNGAATAGATLIAATQNQYTVSGGVSLLRTIPTVSWLNTRNRTAADFLGSYGKITQPGYVAAGVFVSPTVTKSAIYHADAERDEYFSTRFYALGQTAFDHNYSQNLQLQQIYGGGIGFTLFNTPRRVADLKATAQYEKQQFIGGTSGTDVNLIGSTFSADYMLHLKLFTFAQGVSFIPAYNTPRDYSANETDSLAFPAYKNFSFSLSSIDTYLNDSPASLPPTKRNSFQFTMGLTYAIKSKY
jgi:hypothetical protein